MWRVRLVKWLLNGKLSIEEKTVLTNTALSTIGALPLHGIITTDESGRLVINGRVVDMESAVRLRESAKAALENSARNFVREHVKFMAITNGIHQHATPEQGLFAKAALWQGQEEENALRALAQE